VGSVAFADSSVIEAQVGQSIEFSAALINETNEPASFKQLYLSSSKDGKYSGLQDGAIQIRTLAEDQEVMLDSQGGVYIHNFDAVFTEEGTYRLIVAFLEESGVIDGAPSNVMFVRVVSPSSQSERHLPLSADLSGALAQAEQSGNVTAVRASDDEESSAGIVIAGREEVLAKFQFTALNEDMSVQDLTFKVNSNLNPDTVYSIGDEVPILRLYDGDVQIGSAGGYAVALSGDRIGRTFVEDLDFVISKDESKTLTVKGVLNDIIDGADSGTRLYVHLLNEDFEAVGDSGTDTSIEAVRGNEKVLYKTKPIISLPEQNYTLLSGAARPAFSFSIEADEAGDVSWKKIQLEVFMTDASLDALNGVSGNTGSVLIRQISPTVGSNLGIREIIGSNPGKSIDILEGESGFVTIVLHDEEVIPAGEQKTYEVSLSFSDISVVSDATPNASIRLNIQEINSSGVSLSYEDVEGLFDVIPSFIWSDRSAIGHTESTGDWANGRYVSGFPSDSKTAIGWSGANTMLDVQNVAFPSSGTYARGSGDVPFMSIGFQAVNGDVLVQSVEVKGAAYKGTLDTGDVHSLSLYDGDTQVSDSQSLRSSGDGVLFDNMNVLISDNETKTLTLWGSIGIDAEVGDEYGFYLPSADSEYVGAQSVRTNSVTVGGVAANSLGSVRVNVSGSGDVRASKAPDDEESKAGIVIAGREEVLAKFSFSSLYEDMAVKSMRLLVNPSDVGPRPSSGSSDEVTRVKLYDGDTQIGLSRGYTVVPSGDNVGAVYVDDIHWMIPRDENRVIAVVGPLNSIYNGADSGSAFRVHILNEGFEAQGAVGRDTDIDVVSGNEKVVYKSKPLISLPDQNYSLQEGTRGAFAFRVAADLKGSVSWKKIQFFVRMNGADLSLVDAWPGISGNIAIQQISPFRSSNLNISRAISKRSSTIGLNKNESILSNTGGQVTIILQNEEVVPAGAYKDYEVLLPFSSVNADSGASIQLYLDETDVAGFLAPYDEVEGAVDSFPSFIWSDKSASYHSENTGDWANGRYVSGLPSDSIAIGRSFEGVQLLGDLNGDGCFDILDLTLIAKKFGNVVLDNTPEDLNGDGLVNTDDLAAVARDFGKCVVSGNSQDSVLSSVQKKSAAFSKFASILRSIFWVIGN
tara:strand:- start:2204 stop:5626 length:3423 start_codon:yes stop_codon:yes gene_type:complete